MRIIELEAYNQNWPREFEKEVAILKGVLSDNFIAAYHIGSTAIVGIKAKPVIDILLEVKSINQIGNHNQEFEGLGYEAKGEYGIKGRRFFQKGNNERTHHIHIFETGNSEIKRHRQFVEFMNSHPHRAAEYEKLKIELSIHYKEKPEKYAQSKSVFIHNIDIEASTWKAQLTKRSS
jgi:GrpB-like predicted nucleotidyltransferase (UPF0157 family)